MRLPSSAFVVLAALILSSNSATPLQGRSSQLSFLTSPQNRKLCNTLNPKCGLSAAEAQRRFLTPYNELVKKLQRLKRRSRVPVQLGPLIFNQTSKTGLLNIDVPLDASLAPAVRLDVCGAGATSPPTIRDAVVCTVTKDTVAQPPRGNTDPARIGRSNQGRLLWAARLGKRGGTRVFIVTQQHGNEAASTEGALKLLDILTRSTSYSKPILSALDIIILFRANPDGGEVTFQNFRIPFLLPYRRSAGFFRHTVDRTSGGGFASPSERDFFGVVGRGYDMNRYNYGGLQAAIRPVESQALVAAVHAFRPHVLFDLHGDAQKTLCELDPLTLRPSTSPGLPTVQCKPPALPVPTLLTQRESMVIGGFFADDASVLTGTQFAAFQTGPRFTANARFIRSLVADVVKTLDPAIPGQFSRFNQIQVGPASPFSDGTLDRTALAVGAVGFGWEVANFVPKVRPNVSGFNGTRPTPGGDLTDAEPCFLRDNICIHEWMMREALFATAKLFGKRLTGDNGYCAIPLNDGLLFSILGKTKMLPQGGQMNVPVVVSGACRGDLSA